MALASVACAAPSCTIPDLVQPGDGVLCNGCNSTYHFGCAGVQEATQRRKGKEAREKWRCAQRCREKRSASVEKRDMANEEVSLLNQLTDPQLRAVFELINKKISSFIASNEFISAKYDEVVTKLAQSEQRNKELAKTIEQQAVRIEKLENRVNYNDQASRDDCLEFHGVEKEKHENSDDLQGKVKTLLKTWNVDSAGIVKVHRIYSKDGRAPPIMVKFNSVVSRNNVLSKCKKVADKSQGRAFPSANDKKRNIFVGESLNFFYKKLLFNTKAAARDKGYKYTWVADGKIFVRKAQGAKAIKIQNMKDIETLLI